MKAAGLKSERSDNDFKQISDEELISDIVRIARQLDREAISTGDYRNYGRYSECYQQKNCVLENNISIVIFTPRCFAWE